MSIAASPIPTRRSLPRGIPARRGLARRSPTRRSLACRIPALVLVVLLAGSAPPPALAAGDREDYGDLLFILTNDYEFAAGSCATMDMGSPWAVDENLTPLCADAVSREYQDLVYVVGRAGCDHIQVLDPQQGWSTLLQFSTGAGSNPQDICFASPTRAFVTRYDRAELWEIDPSTGEHTDSVDLSPLADADGLPEMMGMAIAGDRLYVGVQRLDRDNYWTPVAPGYLAVIDLATNSLVDLNPGQQGVQGFALAATNPSMLLVADPLTGRILIGQTGNYGALDGGIEIFDPAAEQSLGFAITEAELGGDLNQWTSVDMQRGFAITLSSSWSTDVIAFDLTTGTNLGTVISSNEYAYTHLATDPSYGELYVADASYVEPGVRVFDTATFQPLGGLIPVGLYPRALLPLHGPASGIGGHDPAERGDHSEDAFELTAWPTPAIGPVHLTLRGSDRHADGAQILDAAGREVFHWRGPFGPGTRHPLRWSGHDQAGRPVPSGTYFFRAYGEGRATGKRIQLLR